MAPPKGTALHEAIIFEVIFVAVLVALSVAPVRESTRTVTLFFLAAMMNYGGNMVQQVFYPGGSLHADVSTAKDARQRHRHAVAYMLVFMLQAWGVASAASWFLETSYKKMTLSMVILAAVTAPLTLLFRLFMDHENILERINVKENGFTDPEPVAAAPAEAAKANVNAKTFPFIFTDTPKQPTGVVFRKNAPKPAEEAKPLVPTKAEKAKVKDMSKAEIYYIFAVCSATLHCLALVAIGILVYINERVHAPFANLVLGNTVVASATALASALLCYEVHEWDSTDLDSVRRWGVANLWGEKAQKVYGFCSTMFLGYMAFDDTNY